MPFSIEKICPRISPNKNIGHHHVGFLEKNNIIVDSNGFSTDHSSLIVNDNEVCKELFLWAILTDKRELTLLFWTRGRNKICKFWISIDRRVSLISWGGLGAALIAVLVYQNKARKEKNNQYDEWAKEWEQLAVEILQKFSERNSRQCKQAITRAIPQFDHVTWLQLAIMAQSKLFLAQSAVQDVLTDIWYLIPINKSICSSQRIF